MTGTEPIEHLTELDAFLRLCLAAILGMGIGLQRELAGKPAGLRTHGLICMGSTLFTIVSLNFGGPAYSDPSRVAAGIVTGIGFLGAGAILRDERGRIAGLTTAASIWSIAGIGIAIGLGEFVIGAGCAALTATILAIPKIRE